MAIRRIPRILAPEPRPLEHETITQTGFLPVRFSSPTYILAAQLYLLTSATVEIL